MDAQQLWKEIKDMMAEGAAGRLDDWDREELTQKIFDLAHWIGKGGLIPEP